MNKKIKSLAIHVLIIAILYGILAVLIQQGILSRSMQKLLVPIGTEYYSGSFLEFNSRFFG